ncbi:MAG: SMC-Scp complex subunit ScpB [bacterium]|nr:SMC-Scp complex subunit ScpB [bacterium]
MNSTDDDSQDDDDLGLSLDELSAAYAEVIGGGEDPYVSPDESEELPLEEPEPSDDACEISPVSILEAILFVGHPKNESLTNRQIAALMRGVSPQEIDELVTELNGEYETQQTAFHVTAEGGGYRLALRRAMATLRENFYGKVRTAQLSQAAVDVLALIAYQQPVTRTTIDEVRNKPSGGLLNQLLRRQLISLTRDDSEPPVAHYHTTDRFLDLFDIESLRDLPRSNDLDRA